LIQLVPWDPDDEEAHRHVMLEHPQVEGWIVSVVGLRDAKAYPPVKSTAALHVFAPFNTSSNSNLIDPFALASLFDGSGPAFRTPAGNVIRTGSHAWAHDLNQFGLHARGHYSTGGRDSYTLVFAMRTFLGQLLPNLDLPSTCALYSIGKTQISM